ncbi:MAG: Eco57I restriction-modification methylase domain-containing protein [Clostridiales bacterium]|nr:Eco57I restriction-modification methylase domain-containing protein [Clostridiales bacterium]
MNISRKDFSEYVRSFDFKGLFNYLGWDYSHNTLQPIEIKGGKYNFEIVADKSGFKVIVCISDDGRIPVYSTRITIDNQIKKLLHEHILIFTNKVKTQQVWLYSYNIGGKAKKTEIVYNTSQDPERLYEKAAGLIFDLDEEDKITILDVTNRVNANFAVNAEQVTKKFYDGFKKQHSGLLKLIKGIEATADREWYASITLNRLMFCYFMQKRGFLNNDRNYLRNKLEESKQKLGKNQFYSFYRNFLLTLFHKGFGSHKHTPEVVEMIGRIPYLNGGLFEVHEIEQRCPNIEIDDRAFENIFNLFDQYEWHLDTRECASGNEISPDVLGYIFEKYINDRAQMGAYYTQEDITEYISRNSIIPFVFNKAEQQYRDIFAPKREIWTLLKNSGDKYIFESVKKGVDLSLPDYIKIGVDINTPNLLERRARWNERADEQYALPTEIWREVVERRQRYHETLQKIQSGAITSIQDFITLNLDICAFAQDVVDTVDDPQLIYVVYEAIAHMTVLDPTCGSGAFLFAALNILEPLYSSCLSRMADFMSNNVSLDKKVRRLFEDELEKMSQHPNKAYFIYKSIILNNLYGVDIMKEAAETAKLRLFLKLVSTANPNYGRDNIGIEPLPDIDFNIKCGNTLVGYATEQELQNALYGDLFAMSMMGQVNESMRMLSMATHRYKDLQLGGGEDYETFRESKQRLKERRKALNDILDKTLYEEMHESKPYEQWLADTAPFHWISEFYDIIAKEDGNGGFDVIIGNPPYVEYNPKEIAYKVRGYATEKCSNLYAYVIEKCRLIARDDSLLGMIIPISAFSNASMKDLQVFIRQEFDTSWISSFHQRPAALFNGVLQRLSIYIGKIHGYQRAFYTSGVKRWYSHTRRFLFEGVAYIKSNQAKVDHFLKLGNKIELAIEDKLYRHRPINLYLDKHNVENAVYYRTAGGGYWITILNSPFQTESLSNKSKSFEVKCDSRVISAALNSNIFWWYYCVNYDHFNFKDYMLFGFRMNYYSIDVASIVELSNTMESELLSNAKHYTINSVTRGANETITYNKALSKNTMDLIDINLATAYGFTQEELDYIINYDIKYRLGVEDEND